MSVLVGGRNAIATHLSVFVFALFAAFVLPVDTVHADPGLRLKAGVNTTPNDGVASSGFALGGALALAHWQPLAGVALVPQLELMFARRDVGLLGKAESGAASTTLDVLELPLALRGEFAVGERGVYLAAGAYSGVLMRAAERTRSEVLRRSPRAGSLSYALDLGLVASGGLELVSSSWGTLFAELRYQRGYRRLLASSNVRPQTLSLLLGFGLGSSVSARSSVASSASADSSASSTPARNQRVRLRGGLIATQIYTAGADGAVYRPGVWFGGSFAPTRWGDAHAALVPEIELAFVHRGSHDRLPPNVMDDAIDGVLTLDYVDLALLTRAEIAIQDTTVYGLGGVYGSALVRAQRMHGNTIADMRDDVHSVDAGWLAGVGVEFASLAGTELSLELRYQRGMRDLFATIPEPVTQQSLSCLFGITYGARARQNERPNTVPLALAPAGEPHADSKPRKGTVVRGVLIARPGDIYLRNRTFRIIERITQDDQYGYRVKYIIPGHGLVVMFWPRADIDFADQRPGYRLQWMKLRRGRLGYPTRVTRRSLPAVHRHILTIEADVVAQARGGIEAMEGFAVVGGLAGAGPRVQAARPPSGGSVPNAGRAGQQNAQRAGSATTTGFRKFTRANFRYNLAKLTGGAPPGKHAHHVLPAKHTARFRKAGINNHDPRYGAWWDAKEHLQKAKAYEQAFDDFFGRKASPKKAEILNFARRKAREYGLDVLF